MQSTAQTLAEAVSLHQAGRLDEAERMYRAVLREEPAQVDALHLLGLVAQQRGRPAEAVQWISQALQHRPNFAEAHYNLGLVYRECGQLEAARACFERATSLRPRYAEAFYNLGNTLKDLGRLDEAVAAYQRTLRLRPQFAKALNNLANAYREQGRLEEAAATFRQAIACDPSSAKAHHNLGLTLRALGRFSEALEALDKAVALASPFAEAHNARGTTLQALGRFDEALAAYEQALAQDPQLADAHFNRACAWLRQGDYQRGWAEYEWRFRCKPFAMPALPGTAWDGSAQPGRTLLLYAEQGLGDTLQFVRYLPLVRQRVGRVILACQPALVPLLRASGLCQQVTALGEALETYELYASLLSLPHLLGTTLENVPAPRRYLQADAQLAAQWRDRLGGVKGLRVGICWQGNKAQAFDRLRSFAPRDLAPVALVPGVRLVSLQKGEGSEQLAGLATRWNIIDLGPDFDTAAGPFMDTAAVIEQLDLVISCDTAVAHLAAALGVPVWVALAWSADYRWMLHRDDSPWYPSMRLYRQTRPECWEDVFDRMGAELQKLAAEKLAAAAPAAGTATPAAGATAAAGAMGAAAAVPAAAQTPATPAAAAMGTAAAIGTGGAMGTAAAIGTGGATAGAILVEISAGELLDKISILEIKSARIREPARLANVLRELEMLRTARQRSLLESEPLAKLATSLREVNEQLWQVEDALRACERQGEFGAPFIELARSVYRLNDHRAELKRQINDLAGSRLREEKSYGC
jgi:tetratricopeptide (TPR) repeat protein